MDKLITDFEDFSYLVESIYHECVENGYTKDGAAGKIKYELSPMANSDIKRAILYFELCHFFTKENLKEAFSNCYEDYKSLLKKTDLTELIANSEALSRKENEITKYAKKIKL